MKIKYCKICNKKFLQKSNRQIYCSKECYTKNNIDKKYVKIYNKIHKDYFVEYHSNYYRLHKKELLEYYKKYILLNNKKRKEYKNWYEVNRRKIDINFKILSYLRSRLSSVLKNNFKSKSTMKLLGCSLDFLKQYLEFQFKKGMSWSNYGKWHIDHIKPCASFDLSKPNEQHKCFNYINLQPLWAIDNLRKKDKIS